MSVLNASVVIMELRLPIFCWKGLSRAAQRIIASI